MLPVCIWKKDISDFDSWLSILFFFLLIQSSLILKKALVVLYKSHVNTRPHLQNLGNKRCRHIILLVPFNRKWFVFGKVVSAYEVFGHTLVSEWQVNRGREQRNGKMVQESSETQVIGKTALWYKYYGLDLIGGRAGAKAKLHLATCYMNDKMPITSHREKG